MRVFPFVTIFVTTPVTLGLLLFGAGGALAQVGPTPIPQKHIPAPVLMELRALESQFDQALARDCAPERCVSKGCAYRDHVVVDMPRTSSLPGINQSEGPGSVPVQEYLIQARCEFAHEKSVSPRDVQALVRRLEQRLSKGWLQVTVGRQVLDPISPALSQSPPTRPEPAPPPPAVSPPEQQQPPPQPVRWEGEVALRELWLSLLPHFSWMIALVLATLATLLVIWGLRRLGRESLEEKAMAAQLSSGAFAKQEPDAAAAPATNGEDKERAEREARERATTGFVTEQQRLWKDRVAEADLGKDDGLVVALVRQWLRAGEFDLLAKAILLFGDRLTQGFASDSELAVRKVEFAEHLRTVDPQRLPSDAEFFRTLNQHAISASLLSQSDAAIYRSLRDELGTTGVTQLIERLPLRLGALLFALAPSDCQDQVARALSRARRLHITAELLSSNRISREEREYLFAALDAARTGQPLPPTPAPAANAITDRGREVGAAAALSILLAHVEPGDRQALFAQAFERSGGALPRWFEDILHPAMLLKLPPELRGDLLLEVDIKRLAAWCSIQDPAWQRTFVDSLAPSLQTALRSRANNAHDSRADQLRLARAGHDELVSALKRSLAQGKLSFWELVA
jgi:hypothetical protein